MWHDLLQVGKQFDALLIDVQAPSFSSGLPVFDIFNKDTFEVWHIQSLKQNWCGIAVLLLFTLGHGDEISLSWLVASFSLMINLLYSVRSWFYRRWSKYSEEICEWTRDLPGLNCDQLKLVKMHWWILHYLSYTIGTCIICTHDS